MSASTRREWPVKIKRGSATVRIYRMRRNKAGRTYEEFRVAFYDSEGARRFESFSDFSSAELKANEVVATLARGEAKVLTLTADDRLTYLRARDTINATGVPLDIAAAEYSQAFKILNGRGSLLDAARYFVRTHSEFQPKLVETVVTEFISLRENRTSQGKPASEAYLHDLKVRLIPLGKAFVKSIHAVSPREIEDYVDNLEVGPRSRHNMMRTIRTLFRFAQSRRYFPSDAKPLEGIEMNFVDEGTIGIFSAEELKRLIGAAQRSLPHLLPFLLLGAFAGLRSAEIARLDWSNLRQDYIEVAAAKAKTRSRRLVPILPNMAAWLKDLRKPSGQIIDPDTIAHGFSALTAATASKPRVKKAALPAVIWQPNGLRHSFITYRLAITKNENLVATEAGNSPQMIHRHYREITTEDQAKDWFNIVP